MTTTEVSVSPDGFGFFSYNFEFEGRPFTCRDFSSAKEALSGARFHLHCLSNRLPHEEAVGLGVIYRPELICAA